MASLGLTLARKPTIPIDLAKRPSARISATSPCTAT